MRMSQATHSETDTKLHAVGARFDARLAELNLSLTKAMSKIEGDVSVVRTEIANGRKELADQFAGLYKVAAAEEVKLYKELQGIRNALTPLHAAAKEASMLAGNIEKLKATTVKNIWGAAIAVSVGLVGTIIGGYALGYAAFDSGRDTAAVVKDSQQKIDEAAAAMRAQLEQATATLTKQQEESRLILQEALKVLSAVPKPN